MALPALHIPFNRYGQIEVDAGRFTIRFTSVQQYRDYMLRKAQDGLLSRTDTAIIFAYEDALLKARLDDLGMRIATAQTRRGLTL